MSGVKPFTTLRVCFPKSWDFAPWVCYVTCKVTSDLSYQLYCSGVKSKLFYLPPKWKYSSKVPAPHIVVKQMYLVTCHYWS